VLKGDLVHLILLRQDSEFFLSYWRYDFSRSSFAQRSFGSEKIILRPNFPRVHEVSSIHSHEKAGNWEIWRKILRRIRDGGFARKQIEKYMQGLEPWWHYGLANNFQLVHISACTISRLCFFAKDHFLPWADRLCMLTFCPKCIIMCYINGFEMIQTIFERPKIIIDYCFRQSRI
jgi:hypothetical protein